MAAFSVDFTLCGGDALKTNQDLWGCATVAKAVGLLQMYWLTSRLRCRRNLRRLAFSIRGHSEICVVDAT